MENLEEIQELERGWVGWEFCKGNRRNQSLTIRADATVYYMHIR